MDPDLQLQEVTESSPPPAIDAAGVSRPSEALALARTDATPRWPPIRPGDRDSVACWPELANPPPVPDPFPMDAMREILLTGDQLEDENLTGICSPHHLRGVHGGYLRVWGRAPDDLTWELGGRVWTGSFRDEGPT